MEICMNKKRVTAVILSAMMCMQIFTGCGAKNNAAAVEGGAGQTVYRERQVQPQRKMHRQQKKMCRELQIRMERKKA